MTNSDLSAILRSGTLSQHGNDVTIAFGTSEEAAQVLRALLDLASDRLQSITGKSRVGVTVDARYWLQGTDIIEKCLEKAAKADPADAPMPLVGEDAALWHRAQMEAYRHSLEMMGVPIDERAALEAALPSGVRVNQQAREEQARQIQDAVLSCPHSITGEEVVIGYSSDQSGHNALAQLHARILSAIEPTQAQGEGRFNKTDRDMRDGMDCNYPDCGCDFDAKCSDAPAPDELEVVAWRHPTAGWANHDRSVIEHHCRKDGSDGGPRPLTDHTIATEALTALRAERERLERELEKSKQIAVTVAIKSEKNAHRAKTAEARVAALARTLQSVNRALRDEAGSAVFRSGVKVATLLGQINAALQEEEGGNG